MKEFLIELSNLLKKYEVLIHFNNNKIIIYKFYSDTMDNISILDNVLTEYEIESFINNENNEH